MYAKLGGAKASTLYYNVVISLECAEQPSLNESAKQAISL